MGKIRLLTVAAEKSDGLKLTPYKKVFANDAAETISLKRNKLCGAIEIYL